MMFHAFLIICLFLPIYGVYAVESYLGYLNSETHTKITPELFPQCTVGGLQAQSYQEYKYFHPSQSCGIPGVESSHGIPGYQKTPEVSKPHLNLHLVQRQESVIPVKLSPDLLDFQNFIERAGTTNPQSTKRMKFDGQIPMEVNHVQNTMISVVQGPDEPNSDLDLSLNLGSQKQHLVDTIDKTQYDCYPHMEGNIGEADPTHSISEAWGKENQRIRESSQLNIQPKIRKGREKLPIIRAPSFPSRCPGSSHPKRSPDSGRTLHDRNMERMTLLFESASSKGLKLGLDTPKGYRKVSGSLHNHQPSFSNPESSEHSKIPKRLVKCMLHKDAKVSDSWHGESGNILNSPHQADLSATEAVEEPMPSYHLFRLMTRSGRTTRWLAHQIIHTQQKKNETARRHNMVEMPMKLSNFLASYNKVEMEKINGFIHTVVTPRTPSPGRISLKGNAKRAMGFLQCVGRVKIHILSNLKDLTDDWFLALRDDWFSKIEHLVPSEVSNSKDQRSFSNPHFLVQNALAKAHGHILLGAIGIIVMMNNESNEKLDEAILLSEFWKFFAKQLNTWKGLSAIGIKDLYTRKMRKPSYNKYHARDPKLLLQSLLQSNKESHVCYRCIGDIVETFWRTQDPRRVHSLKKGFNSYLARKLKIIKDNMKTDRIHGVSHSRLSWYFFETTKVYTPSEKPDPDGNVTQRL